MALVQGWHFLRPDGCLNHPPHTKVEAGQTLTATDRPIDLCRYGLHASKRAIDALEYAPGPIVCRVRLSGEILEGDDKLCATERTVLWMADATKELRLWGAWCVRQALMREERAGRNLDPRSLQGVEAAEAYARGEIGEKELAAAWDAARDAARDAAWASARAAARDAACAAAWEEASYAAGAAQNSELERRLTLLGEA